jgi:hypothetical protein
LSYSLFREKPGALLVALGFLVTMVLSSVLKVMFMGVIAVALLFWLFWKSAPRKSRVVPSALKWGLAAALAVVLAGDAFTRIDVISSDRLGDLQTRIREDPQALGPIQAHAVAAAKIGGGLTTLALGLGPFRFANPISFGQVLADGSLSQDANSDLLAIGDEKGEQARVTLTSSLLAEFGVPAFIVLALTYLVIGRAVWRCRTDPRVDIRWRADGLVASGSILLMIPLTSLFGSFDVMSVSWPLMLLSGLVCHEAAVPPDQAEPQARPAGAP